MHRDWTDILLDNFGWISLAIFIVGVFGIYASIQHDNRVRAQFMEQCLKDHKEYECMALWGQAQGPSSTVVPMPIIIPMGR